VNDNSRLLAIWPQANNICLYHWLVTGNRQWSFTGQLFLLSMLFIILILFVAAVSAAQHCHCHCLCSQLSLLSLLLSLSVQLVIAVIVVIAAHVGAVDIVQKQE
jgi:hypothetical protein